MALDRDRISHELEQLIPPELLSTRSGYGPSDEIHYLPIQIARALADDIFGYANWKCEVTHQSIDFYEEFQEGDFTIYSYEVSCCVRVTLIDGTHREDVAGGQSHGRVREEAERNAKMTAKSNATKRCLRQFGNLLGNCLYDNEYEEFLKSFH